MYGWSAVRSCRSGRPCHWEADSAGPGRYVWSSSLTAKSRYTSIASRRWAVERPMCSSAAMSLTRSLPWSRKACSRRSALSTDSSGYGGLFFTAESYVCLKNQLLA